MAGNMYDQFSPAYWMAVWFVKANQQLSCKKTRAEHSLQRNRLAGGMRSSRQNMLSIFADGRFEDMPMGQLLQRPEIAARWAPYASELNLVYEVRQYARS